MLGGLLITAICLIGFDKFLIYCEANRILRKTKIFATDFSLNGKWLKKFNLMPEMEKKKEKMQYLQKCNEHINIKISKTIPPYSL